jgi:hypothetical protein
MKAFMVLYHLVGDTRHAPQRRATVLVPDGCTKSRLTILSHSHQLAEAELIVDADILLEVNTPRVIIDGRTLQ